MTDAELLKLCEVVAAWKDHRDGRIAAQLMAAEVRRRIEEQRKRQAYSDIVAGETP